MSFSSPSLTCQFSYTAVINFCEREILQIISPSDRRSDGAKPAFCCYGGGGPQSTVLQFRRNSWAGVFRLPGGATEHFRLPLRPHAYRLPPDANF